MPGFLHVTHALAEAGILLERAKQSKTQELSDHLNI